ncbi:MAG: hypothetical protein NVS3B5_04850 [Sphingomicrobium sp.]
MRLIGSVIASLVTWAIIATILNLGLRHSWADYAAVEKVMTFTYPMMVARLGLSGVSSLVAGFLAAWIDKRRRASIISGAILLMLFLPVHYSLWEKFPIWYHLTFLASLPLLGWAGGTLWRPRLATTR